MEFVADECVDKQIIEGVRKLGHDVYAIAEQTPGITDEEVLKIATNNKRILITQDKDFGELVYRLGQAHYGVVLLRLSGLPMSEKALLASTIINTHLDKLPGSFTVVYKDLVKIRRQ